VKLAQWGSLLAYPGPDYHACLRECLAAAPSQLLQEFAQRVEGLPVEALQELHTQTFDWNPDTTLDIGWHLFGENYDRGDFLVKVRGALRTYGVSESGELPDHLSNILRLLTRMPAGERETFAAEFLLPAIGKLRDGLAKTESMFLPLIDSVREQIAALLPEPVPSGVEHD
jgi:nitrate reductase assembly molybdenum cofactor insertion protein NarJ